MNTLAPKHQFEPIMTQSVHDTPLACITSIRFRKSVGLKNTLWIKPALTDQLVSKMGQQAQQQQKPEEIRNHQQLLAQLQGLKGPPTG